MRVEKIILRYEITPAQLLFNTTPARMEISMDRGGLRIENDRIRLRLDNRKYFDSIGIKSMQSQSRENAERGKQAVLETVGRYSQQKTAMTGPDRQSIAQVVAAQRRPHTPRTVLAFLPEAKPEASWEGGELNMHFIKDKVEIKWHPAETEFTYVPYSVKFHVERV
jgi:hypothetical protein